ncbi:MAG: hypothetical protein M3421_07470, partial [Bacteroidota bacterium]|nr:hypothetical protein [Bacteroidota bacterium]
MNDFFKIGVLLFFLFNVALTKAQEPLMPGIYNLGKYPAPLYSIPYRQYLDSYSTWSSLRIQTKPLQQLQHWGVRYAVVSRQTDSITHQIRNQVIFLNEQKDTPSEHVFKSSQTEALFFETHDSLTTIQPKYSSNPFERQQNGIFSFYGNSFSIHKYPTVETYLLVDESSGERVQGTELVFEAGVFNVLFPKPYDHMIQNIHAERIPIYKEPRVKRETTGFFENGEYLFVVRDSLDGLWIRVEKQELVASKLKSSQGWVRMEDLYAGKWRAHRHELPGLRFKVAGTDADNDHSGERGELSAIKVIDKKSGRVRQVITDIGAQLFNPLSESLEFIDANFDGYPDIMSSYAEG